VEKLLTVRQLQELLGVDRVTIYRMLEGGQLPGFKVGGQWRFSQSEIEGWLQDQRAQGDGRLDAGSSDADDIDDTCDLPLSCMTPIQNIYSEALGVMAVTLDPAGRPVTPASTACELCQRLHATEAGRRLCAESWRVACATHPAGAGLRCPAGLRQMVYPVTVEQKRLAFVLAGGYVCGAEEAAGVRSRVARVAQAAGVDPALLLDATESIRVLSDEEQERADCLLRHVATTFEELCSQRLQFLGRLQRIADIASMS
jgi:excisionase family DNA binding protein